MNGRKQAMKIKDKKNTFCLSPFILMILVMLCFGRKFSEIDTFHLNLPSTDEFLIDTGLNAIYGMYLIMIHNDG